MQAGCCSALPHGAAVGLAVFPFVFLAAVVPITVAYALARAVAPYVAMTIPRRLAIGALLGALTVASYDWGAAVHIKNAWTAGTLSLLVTRSPYTVYAAMEMSAIVLALAARPRWFGVVLSARL